MHREFSINNRNNYTSDIGANLTDPMYQGIYGGSTKHQPDLTQVLNRGWTGGLDRIIVTVGTITDCEPTFDIVKNDGRQRSDFEVPREVITFDSCTSKQDSTQRSDAILRGAVNLFLIRNPTIPHCVSRSRSTVIRW